MRHKTGSRTLPKWGNGWKPLLAAIILIATNTSFCGGQNLIPNPSFELRDSCPSGWHEGFPFPSGGSPGFARDWYRPTVGTSDYFNACSPVVPPIPLLPVSVPVNFGGYQVARTGTAYAGAILDDSHCEYIESPLSNPLVADHHIFVSFWLNSSEMSCGGADRFGAFFSQDSIEMPNTFTLDMFTPQVFSPAGSPLYDTANWIKVASTFVASGGERWVTFGNFNYRADLDTMNICENGGFGIGMYYYYYDDICVLDMEGAPSAFSVYDTILCDAPSLTLSGRSGMEAYLWNDDSTGMSKTITEAGIYWVKSVDINSCTLFADTFKITGAELSLPLHIGPEKSICDGQALQLSVSGNFERYRWSTGATTPSIQVTTPGTYWVSAITDCDMGSDTVTITAGAGCGNCIFIPNAFSPNNDGVNDIFKINPVCSFSYFQFEIFNRYGERVFFSNDPERGWNGLYKGLPSDVGTYFYNIRVQPTGANNTQQDFKGDLALLK